MPLCLWAGSLIIHLGAEPRSLCLALLLYLISFLYRFINFTYLDNISPPQLLPDLSYFPAHQLHVISLCLSFFPLFLCQEGIQTNSQRLLAWVRPAQVQTRQNPSADTNGYKIPPLMKKPLQLILVGKGNYQEVPLPQWDVSPTLQGGPMLRSS